jgi:hypothetical protein
MPSPKLNKVEKLIQHQEKEAKLTDELKKHWGELMYKNGAMKVDDKLLLGFLKFANDAANKHHPILAEFAALAPKPSPPRKR